MAKCKTCEPREPPLKPDEHGKRVPFLSARFFSSALLHFLGGGFPHSNRQNRNNNKKKNGGGGKQKRGPLFYPLKSGGT